MGAPIDTTIVADEVGMPHIASHPHRTGNITLFLDTGIWHRLGVVRWRGLYIHHTLSKNTLLHEHHDTATLGRGTCQ